MNRRTLLVFAAALPFSRAFADEDPTPAKEEKFIPPAGSVELSMEYSKPASIDAIARYGKDWLPFVRWASFIGVKTPKGSWAALSVLAIDVVAVYDSYILEKDPSLTLPLPLILNADRQEIGVLPAGFPEEPPSRLRVFFADWVDQIPRRVFFYEAGAAAQDPEFLPYALAYDEKSAKYTEFTRRT